MTIFNETQPGCLWYPVRHKALSYSWARTGGLGGAMCRTANNGTIRVHNLIHHVPIVMARQKPENAAYMGSGMAGSGFMNYLNTALKYGKSFLKGALPSWTRNTYDADTPGSYMIRG